jgi:coenzyme Q-binding protein COQ10
MPRHSETRRLPYSPEQMFDLVADVARYGEFLPWVAAVRVRSNNDTSRVHKQRPERIHVDYIDGPLKHLSNDWKFRPDGQGGTLVDFCVDFAFKNRLFETIAGQMFDTALRKMINAFETRADALYGGGATAASGISRSSAHSAA